MGMELNGPVALLHRELLLLCKDRRFFLLYALLMIVHLNPIKLRYNKYLISNEEQAKFTKDIKLYTLEKELKTNFLLKE